MTGYVWTALAAYLVGSIPTGYLWARARGIDIRSQGSGNIGATNVFRILGKRAGISVLLIDAVKGYVPVKFLLFGDAPPQYLAMTAGLFAILGHNYTCWLRFKGGKGIATSAGVLLGLMPAGLGVTLAVWLLVFAISRYVSLASVVAAAALPVGVWALGYAKELVVLGALLGALAIYKHRANITRLIAGTEPRFTRRPKGEKA